MNDGLLVVQVQFTLVLLVLLLQHHLSYCTQVTQLAQWQHSCLVGDKLEPIIRGRIDRVLTFHLLVQPTMKQ